MKVMAAYSDNLHGKVSAKKMSRKWGIGLEKAKSILDFMTQMNFRSAILSLTKRYQTDLLSHKLMRFIVKLYTDNLFADENSMRGNKRNIVSINQPPVDQSVLNVNIL